MRRNFDRFDLIVIGVLLALGIATGLVLLRGDQVGVIASDLVPAPDATGVSIQTEVRLTFDQSMEKPSVEERLMVTPPLTGTFRWRGKTLIWQAQSPLMADTRYGVTLRAGAESAQGRVLKDDISWSFYTGFPSVLFMSVGDVSQLHEIGPNGTNLRQLTRFEDGSSVWDYSVSPDGSQIAFGLVRPDASAVELWLMNADGSDARRLLACDDSQCSGATWSTDGRRLAYERRELNVNLGDVGMGLGPSRVWLFNVSNGENAPLFRDSQMLGYGPHWSPDGSRLAYFDPNGGVRILNLDDGASQLIPNQLGEIGTWSPDSQALALVDMSFVGESYSSFIIRADLNNGTTYSFTNARTKADEGSPAWAPTGEWIAFGRKALVDGTPTHGQQLWLMRPDGSEARPLVIDARAHLGSFAWSPHSKAIAYLRLPLMQADARPEIWLVSLDGSEPVKLAEGGTLPAWLP